jgi:hypothetical protein
VIYCDNQSCVRLSENLVFHDRSKHIKIKYYYLRDRVQKGEVNLQYISTDEQTTDSLTKPLSRTKFVHFRDKLRACGDCSLGREGVLMINIMDSECASGWLVQDVQIAGEHSRSGEWFRFDILLMYHG